jgi:hypothetical protein
MNILTDILSLIRQNKFSKVAERDDVLVLGKWNEQPDMTGVASPIPYKSVKLIKIKDFKVEGTKCDYKNTPEKPSGDIATVYQKTETDPVTGECTVYFRTLKSMSPNLTLAQSADNDFVEIDTIGEPNLAANVGTGSGLWKNKVGETLNFKSIIAGNNITIAEAPDQITINATSSGGVTYTLSSAGQTSGGPQHVNLKLDGSDGSLSNVKLFAGSNVSISDNGSNEVTISSGGGMTTFNVYDENPSGAGPGFSVSQSDNVLMWGRNGVEVITGVPLGSTSNPKSVAMGLSHYYEAYVSQVTQLGNGAPTENVIYNDTGRTLSWSRPSVGRYTATWSTSVDPSKVTINIAQVFKNHPNIANIIAVTGNSFTITTNLVENAAIADDSILLETPLEIRIYP